ncbi:MAG: hypothetical protein R2909_10060 [Gemmatimonadales bacterium]
MTVVSLGLDAGTASIATREAFLIAPTILAARLAGDPALAGEPFLLSTCNRIEVYASAARCPDAALDAIARAWAGDRDRLAWLEREARRRVGLTAARHLVRVAVGLESQVIGDRQVAGQLRRAYAATGAGRAKGELARLIETALQAGRRGGRRGGGARTVGARAVDDAVTRLGGAAPWLVVGAGRVAGDVVRRLARRRLGPVTIANRSPDRAERLAQLVGADVVSLAALPAHAAASRVMVLAAEAGRPLLTAPPLAAARATADRAGRPLLIIDLAIPRAADPSVARLSGVELLTLDDLAARPTDEPDPSALASAERIVDGAVERFAAWLELDAARHAVEPLRVALAEICGRELAHAAPELASRRLLARISGKLMAGPMRALEKRIGDGRSVAPVTDAIRELFPQA